MRDEAHDIQIVNFVDKCSKRTKKLLGNLKKSYTPIQVPAVLEHNCDVYMSMFSFDTEKGTQVGTPNDHARCEIFTKQLENLFWKVYESKNMEDEHFGVSHWCKNICDTKYGAAPECDVVFG